MLSNPFSRPPLVYVVRSILALVFTLIVDSSATAATTVTLSGPQQVGPITPDANGRFAFPTVALKRNSVNVFTVTAIDDFGNTLTKNVSITQLSLQSVVVSKVTTTPLTVQQVQQLVNDGVIKLDNPANFNVSKFDIVLTIGKESVPISVPIARSVVAPLETAYESPPPLPRGDGGGGSGLPDVAIIVFEQPVAGPPGQDPPPPIPGVIIIEGRIKTLKEFYSVRLLLMNASGIFTLSSVRAEMEFPDGGLSNTLPEDGIVSFGDILPGTPDQPGQAEREFIIRGDEIGVRAVRVNFGGTLTGPGIPDDSPIPFNGSALSSVEVKGPPTFLVQVTHPPAVVAKVPYELVVNIQNTGETAALYASIDLDVGAAAKLVDCKIDDVSLAPVCTPLVGPATRSLGNILPGQTVKESFTILPLDSGPITSCMAMADQNITLQVFVGDLGCLVGTSPPLVGVPDGIPTVSVLPTPNLMGVGIDSPVVGFFSKQMNGGTITTGSGGTFRVLDDSGNDVPGQLQITSLNGNTVAIWQVFDGITNRLNGNSLYSINLTQDIRDLDGNSIANAWTSQFTTTSPTNDRDPPALTLSIQPPVNPNQVIPGQLIRINAYASDQGTGVARIELRRMQVGVANAIFELIDQKTIFDTSSGPCLFTVDSARLVPGATYQFKATAYDHAGNAQDATIPVILAVSAAIPVVRLPADPASPVLQGIAVDLTPIEVSGGVAVIGFFLDGATVPFATVTLPPFQASLATLTIPLGPHTVRAVAVDGLQQTGEAILNFILDPNPNRPKVGFAGITNGANFTVGTPLPVTGNISDPAGIASVQYYLDTVGGTPLATGVDPFTLKTSGLTTGDHKLIVVATNNLGVSNDPNDPGSFVNFSILPVTNGQPPSAPGLNPLSVPVNGKVTLSGSSVAGGRIDITNVTQGLNYTVSADASGAFSALIDANGGDVVRAVAFDFTTSQQPSAPAQAIVPAPPALVRIEVTPTSINFTSVNEFRDVTVTGFFADGSTANVTSSAAYSSSNLGASSVNGSGRVVAIASGNATITASFQGQQAQVAVTVLIRTLVSITLNPSSFTLTGISKTQQLSVSGNYSDNSTSPITTGVIFSSNQIAVAVVSVAGLVTSTGVGSAAISATVAGLPPAQSNVTVAAIVVTGIAVSPNTILFTTAGETRQLQVSRTLSDGTTEPAPPPVTFDSSDTNVATVGINGAVSAVANGNATITAHHAGFAATVAVTVKIPVITLPPPVITSIDRPRAGEGDAFAIRGDNFASIPDDNIVRINGLQAEVQSARQDELVAIVPPGATSGPVTVEVVTQLSNAVNLGIYGRIAQSSLLTGAVDIAASPGSSLTFTLPPFEVRAGDRVLLSSAPDILAPLSFQGNLQGVIDGGAPFAISLSASATDLTVQFTPGFHTLELDLFESGGRIRTGPIYLIVGPDGTGAIAGQRSVIALAQSRTVPVTFINLKDLSGNPLPDGATVIVTAQQMSLVTPDNCCFISSAGGTIVNGAPNPFDSRFKTFTVTGGRIDVQYDPFGAAALAVGSAAVANIQVVPANSNGSGIGNRTFAVQPVTFTTFDTAATPRSQSAVIADGAAKIVTIKLAGIRDTAGNLVPDGATVIVTAQQMSLVTPDNCCFIGSAGGTIVNGAPNPFDSRFRTFTVTGGQIEIQYNPGNVQLPVGVVQTANVQVLPARPDGSGIGNRVFTIIPVLLSSPSVAPANITVAPPTELADAGDNRVVVTVKNIVDALGNPVPDGTTVIVTAQQMSLVTPDNCCFINSAGGTIVNGNDNPFDSRFKTFTVTGGEVQIVYSSTPVAIGTRQSATARVQLVPATPSGAGIGNRTFAVADVTLTGYQTATGVATPASAVADGFSKIITVRLTGIQDTAGNLVPDGATVIVTAQQMSLVTPDNCCFIGSAGGTIVNGAPNPHDSRFKTFTVTGGQVVIQYDPGNVQLPVGTIATANVQAVPARPDGSGIGNRAFVVVPITLSSASTQPINVAVNPTSVLANAHDNRATVTVSNISDSLGNLVPNGTTVAVTAQQISLVTPDGCCFINSAGGTIVNGTTSASDARFQTLTVTGGQVQVSYSAAPVAVGTRQPTTARVQLLPANPAGVVIGNRAFAVADVTLTAFQSADISGLGSVAPNASTTYIVANIVDTTGNPVPDGTTVLATVQSMALISPDGCCFVNSSGGTITNGAANPFDSRLKTFTVSGGSITINFTAPSATGTSTIQLLPARPDGSGIGNKVFALKSVGITP
jgi:hypothetical protein